VKGEWCCSSAGARELSGVWGFGWLLHVGRRAQFGLGAGTPALAVLFFRYTKPVLMEKQTFRNEIPVVII